MLHQLRQPRYLALGAIMVLVATGCVIAGTWQVFRFAEKHAANRMMRHNAHAPIAPVGAVLAPATSPEARDRAHDAQFRRVRASGTYDTAAQVAVRERTVDGAVGFLVLTPLRIAGGPVLLVVRGFVAADADNPSPIAAPPTGVVSVVARVEPPEERDDHYGRTAPGQVTAINPDAVARRLGAPVYSGYAELLSGQAGTSGLTAIPEPDLSNPAGGAVEPQHLAYIVQWYLFALLALAAPLVMARADSRRPDEDSPDLDELDDPVEAEREQPTAEQSARTAKLADRYGVSRRI